MKGKGKHGGQKKKERPAAKIQKKQEPLEKHKKMCNHSNENRDEQDLEDKASEWSDSQKTTWVDVDSDEDGQPSEDEEELVI